MTTPTPPQVIGIAGPSGAGKSTIVDALARELAPCAVLHLDDYFRHPDTFPVVDGSPHWDLPSNLDFAALRANLDDLIAGGGTVAPTFDKRSYASGTRTIEPAPTVLVEGFFLYCDDAVRDRLQCRLWLDLPEEEQIRRRTQRDPTRAVYIRTVVLPAFREYGLPTRAHAHSVIDASGTPEEVVRHALAAIRAT